MRPKIVIPILLLGAALIASILFFGTKGERAAQAAPPAGKENAGHVTATTSAPVLSPKPAGKIPSMTPGSLAPRTEEEQANEDAAVAPRVGELNDWGVTDDPANLRKILAELDNPEPQIRAAAVEAAVQFKSPEAIPALQDALAQATNLDEAVNIREAIRLLSITNTPPAGAVTSNQ